MLGNNGHRRKLAIYISSEKNYHRICLMLVSGLKAAAQGNFVAHFYGKNVYQNGDGVEKYGKKPGFHLSNAAEGGIKPALKALNELEHQTK